MYLRADEVLKQPLIFNKPLVVPTSLPKSKPTLFLEMAQRRTFEVVWWWHWYNILLLTVVIVVIAI
jgi:hypothetical protein